MAERLIATKLHAPTRRGGLVERPRILERLDRAADARMTLVSAPAGFGKTTLLTEWLEEGPGDDRSVAWLSLDPADRDPMSFWTYVLTALETAVPGVGAGALDLLASGSAPIELVLTTLVNDLAAAAAEVWLVLDDFHAVDGSEITEPLGFLLEHLPAQAHVVVSTRADPSLPLSRWRARGELVEVRAADLRFASDEVAMYLHEAGVRLADEDVAVLAERTEGWIAALQLAALSLRDRADGSDFVARFAGNDRFVVDYLADEVLAHQTPEIRAFLLRTSVVDRLTGPLSDALTGREDGSDVLVALDRANLFLVPLDDRREWYRYHHLFADVLRARLLSEQPHEVPLLHQRASSWFERHDLTDEAVAHALAASDFDRAAYLMELAAPAIRRSRRDAVILGWLMALPDEVVQRSPVLSVFAGYGRMLAGDLVGAERRFADAEAALAAVPDTQVAPWADTVELHNLPATIAVYRASLAQARGDVVATTAHARSALEVAAADDHLGRSGGAGFLGLAAWASGDVASALQSFGLAVASMHAAGALVDELTGTIILADLWLAAGRPSRARRLYEGALQVAREHGAAAARAAADLHVGLCELDVEAGDLEGAERHLQAASGPSGPAGMPESRYRWFVARSAAARAAGDLDTAIALLDEAEPLYHPGFFPDVRPIAAMRARILIARGRLPEATDWAGERGLSPSDDVDYLHEFDHLTLVRLLLAQHRERRRAEAATQALGLLERLHTAAEAARRDGSLLEIRLLQALAIDAQGRRPQALDRLEQALALAPEPEGYARLLLDEGAPMLELLRAAEGSGVVGEQASRLRRLGARADADAPGPSRRGEGLSERELEVLRLLDSELSGPDIARRLFVSHNTLRTHTKHIFTKLDVTSRRAAVLRAHELGLL